MTVFQETNWPESVFQSAFTVFYSLLGLGIPSRPKQSSGRILCLSICITGAVIFWSYSAGLVSCLTVETYDLPIQSLQVGRIKLIEIRNRSSLKKIFENSPSVALKRQGITDMILYIFNLH